MLKNILLASAVLTLVSPARAADMEVTINVPGYSEGDASAALLLFRRNCRPLGNEFWSDIEKVEIEIERETAPSRLSLGWVNTVHLKLKYSDEPERGPSFATGPGVLAGHTLHYRLGGGETAGYVASKRASQYLCGLSFNNNGDDVFMPVPELKPLAR